MRVFRRNYGVVMQSETLGLLGLRKITPTVHQDSRGFFMQSYHEPSYRAAGISCPFVQDNHSRSVKGTIRGMHYQQAPGQAKLVRVVHGRIFDVAVDIRPSSPTFGQWEGVWLDAQDHVQLFVPVGFAHGFCVVSDTAEVLYKTSSIYDGATESGFVYNDPDVGIKWPIAAPEVSERDRTAPKLSEIRTSLPAVAYLS
jgi:dTDP-4-dehydrorhamnose 3,5-epimerase